MTALADKSALLSFLAQVARDAGVVVREVYAQPFDVELKGPADPVTVADRRANALIIEAIEKAYPGVPIVAEESEGAAYAGFESAPAAFFVDPLDGTAEFVDKNGEFVVMIGLAEAGRATAGVVYAPETDTLWAGAVGVPATLTSPDGSRPIHVKNAVATRHAQAAVSRRRRSPELDAFLAREDLVPVPIGSSGLKAVAVAAGEVDAYVHVGSAGKLWDSCAPEAIVRAAGGEVTSALGERIDYAQAVLALRGGVVMANPALHDAIVRSLGIGAP